MKQAISGKRRKQEILVCILLILFMVLLAIKMDGLYLDSEKAFRKVEELNGIGPSEKILLQKKSEDGQKLYFVGLLKLEEDTEFQNLVGYEGEQGAYYSIVVLEKVWNLFWAESRTEGAYIEYFNQEISAWYKKNMGVFLGACQNPEVTEVRMKWGHWMEDAEENWVTYDMGKATYPIGEDGFFYQEVDESRALLDEKGREMLIQTTYLEGRDKNGKILYRQGIDDEGRRFVNNEEVQ